MLESKWHIQTFQICRSRRNGPDFGFETATAPPPLDDPHPPRDRAGGAGTFSLFIFSRMLSSAGGLNESRGIRGPLVNSLVSTSAILVCRTVWEGNLRHLPTRHVRQPWCTPIPTWCFSGQLVSLDVVRQIAQFLLSFLQFTLKSEIRFAVR